MQARLVIDGTEECLEEAREGARLGPRAGLTGNGIGHLVEGHGIRVEALALRILFDELIGAVALVGVQGFDEGIGEGLDMAGGDPGLTRQDD